MGAIGPVLFGLQLASKISAQRREYKTQQRAYEKQADAARQNAAITARKNEQTADAYAQKQAQLNDRMRLARGQAAAQAGASGLTMDGSVIDILDSSYDEYTKDSLNLLRNQRNDTWSNYVNKVNYLNQASAYDNAAKLTRKQGHQKIFGTILGAAASAYGQGWLGGSGSTEATSTDSWTKTGVNFSPQTYTYEGVPGWGTGTFANTKKWNNVLNGKGSIFGGGLFE